VQVKKVFRLNLDEVALAMAEFLIKKQKVTREELTGKANIEVGGDFLFGKTYYEITLEVK
jgi:hypothetical protein